MLDVHWRQHGHEPQRSFCLCKCFWMFGHLIQLDLTRPKHKQDPSYQNTAAKEPDSLRPKEAANVIDVNGSKANKAGLMAVVMIQNASCASRPVGLSCRV